MDRTTRLGLLLGAVILTASALVGCGSCSWNLDVVDYTPLPGDGWKTSTPEAQGLDPRLLSEFYFNAAKLETLYGLLVVKNGYLIAEGYFNEGSIDQLSARHSATKSYTSALAGIALERGDLSSLNQKMIDFFPEYADRITDSRKMEISIEQLLQMRAGYPFDSTGYYGDILYLSGNWHWLEHLVDFPLAADPGTVGSYSSVTSHILGVILARAGNTDLISYSQEHLFSPINAELGGWTRDADGYNWGWGEIYVTARSMAKFGLLYLRDGEFEENQIIPAEWVGDSLKSYSDDPWVTKKLGRHFGDLGYGYQWWSATVGDHRFNFVWGHGGQLIVLLKELDMLIVTTASPLNEIPPADGWKYEKTVFNLVGKFIKTLPVEQR